MAERKPWGRKQTVAACIAVLIAALLVWGCIAAGLWWYPLFVVTIVAGVWSFLTLYTWRNT